MLLGFEEISQLLLLIQLDHSRNVKDAEFMKQKKGKCAVKKRNLSRQFQNTAQNGFVIQNSGLPQRQEITIRMKKLKTPEFEVSDVEIFVRNSNEQAQIDQSLNDKSAKNGERKRFGLDILKTTITSILQFFAAYLSKVL